MAIARRTSENRVWLLHAGSPCAWSQRGSEQSGIDRLPLAWNGLVLLPCKLQKDLYVFKRTHSVQGHSIGYEQPHFTVFERGSWPGWLRQE